MSPGVDPATRTRLRVASRRNADAIGLLVVLLLVVGVYLHYDPTMFTASDVSILSIQFLPLVLVAMAQTVTMLTGGIDLSVGAVLALSMAVFATTAGPVGGSVGSAVGGALLAAVVAVLVGAVNGCFVAFAGLPPIIVTLSASFLWSGVTLLVLPKPGGSVPTPVMNWFTTTIWIFATPLILAVVILVLWKLVARTPFGLTLYALGGNESGAHANGLPVRRTRVLAYGLAGLFTGLAGIALTLQSGSGDPTVGDAYTLNSIAASVLGGASFLGGVGTMRGTVCGAVIIGLIANLLLFTGLSPFYQLVVQGAVLIVAITLRNLTSRRRNGAA